ncbi:MAG: oligosaccharide flippase family protein [Opitutae bacterium]|nr:oligosaccharide flippase family protein [Opitutae bacterium]
MISDEGAPETPLTQASAGYRSTVRSQIVRVVCKLAGVVVLARLVSPADHGLFAMGASLTLLLTLFRDFGTGAVAIQVPQLTEGQKTALWQLHAGLGVVLTGLTLLFAPAIAKFYGEPQVGPLLAVMSASFFLIGLNAWPRALLNRDLRFRESNYVETLAAIVGTLVMISGGALGAGAYAFALFVLVSESVMIPEAWRLCGWRPTAKADWAGIGELGRTGLHLTGYNVLLYGVQQADVLLLGKWFGPGSLGLYSRSGQLLVQPTTHLAAPFSQVLLATLSRLGPRSPEFARHLRDTANAIAHFTLPVAVLCFVRPTEVVHLVLGPHWGEAAPLLRWVAVSAAVSFLTVTIYPLCISAGNTIRLTQLTMLTLPVILIGLWAGKDYGPTGVAAGLACANLALLLPRLWWATFMTAAHLNDFLEAFIGPLGVAIAFGVGLQLGAQIAGQLGPLPRLLTSLGAGIVAVGMIALVWARARTEFRALWSFHPFKRSEALPS